MLSVFGDAQIALSIALCPLWVKSGHKVNEPRGLHLGINLMSAYSQKRTLALPKEVEHWSLTTLREKLVKIGAKLSVKSLKW